MAEQIVTRKREHPEDVERVAQAPTRIPAVDVYENPDGYVLEADMPGVGRESLSIHIDEDELTIDGERHDGEATKGRGYAMEVPPMSFHRKFTLPEGVDADRVAAELTAGVLTLRLPKSPGVKPRKIEIKGGT